MDTDPQLKIPEASPETPATDEDLLRVLLSSSSDQIYFKDKRSRFMRINARMAAVMGLDDPADAVGKSDFDIYSSEHATEAFNDEQRIMETGQAIVGKIEKETWPDGRITWASTSKLPLTNCDGDVIGTFGISRDVTESVEAEKEVARLNRQLVHTSRQAGMAEVSTGMLHNIGNILNTTNLSASIIAETIRNSKLNRLADIASLVQDHADQLPDFLQNDERGKQVPAFLSLLAKRLTEEQNKILEEMRVLTESVEHIKAIVALQQGYASASGAQERFSVGELIDDAVRMHRNSFSRHGVTLTLDVDPLPNLISEKHKILQILVNLLHNAKSACDFEGNTRKEITIRAKQSTPETIRIEVSDTGVGIPQENLSRIFDHGFTTRKDGHGFGLHTSVLAAKSLGGKLFAQSEGDRKGATFTVELPIRNQVS